MMESFDSLFEELPIGRISLSAVAFLFYLILRGLSSKSVFKRAALNSFDSSRSSVVRRVVRTANTLVFLSVLAVIWEISLKGLSIYLASFLTIVGVGMFATWSILSNVTASIILFFFFPFRMGSKVKIIDGDNSVEGVVSNLSLFSIKINLEDESEVYYPNNLAIQKGIRHLK